MFWLITLLGAGCGLFLAGPAGALLGAVLGQALDRYWLLDSWQSVLDLLQGRPPLQGGELLFVVLGRLAKSGGRVEDAHIRQAYSEMHRLGLSRDQQQQAIRAFNRGKEGVDDLHKALPLRCVRQGEAEGLLRACWRMAHASGRVAGHEKRMILCWGEWLGMSAARVLALDAAHRPQPNPTTEAYGAALKILGVSSTAGPAEVKRAYRRLLSRHHPDKIAGKGAAPKEVQVATQRTSELHQAYGVIRQHWERS